jgi:hypothetical protein
MRCPGVLHQLSYAGLPERHYLSSVLVQLKPAAVAPSLPQPPGYSPGALFGHGRQEYSTW